MAVRFKLKTAAGSFKNPLYQLDDVDVAAGAVSSLFSDIALKLVDTDWLDLPSPQGVGSEHHTIVLRS